MTLEAPQLLSVEGEPLCPESAFISAGRVQQLTADPLSTYRTMDYPRSSSFWCVQPPSPSRSTEHRKVVPCQPRGTGLEAPWGRDDAATFPHGSPASSRAELISGPAQACGGAAAR